MNPDLSVQNHRQAAANLEGCVENGCRLAKEEFASQNAMRRKNSVSHMTDQLPIVTEGVEIKPNSYESSSIIGATINSVNNLHRNLPPRRPQNLLRDLALKARESQEDNNCNSTCSSSSLERSSERRSSSVSQCSSVLSEGTRNQLNFDLSPDLPPDSSLLEANAISPSEDFGRPGSPEPDLDSLELEANEEHSRSCSRMCFEHSPEPMDEELTPAEADNTQPASIDLPA